METGKIRIKDKVYFEPDGLEKPRRKDFRIMKRFIKKFYDERMKEYEASKQLIEVRNWVTIDYEDKNCSLLLSEIPYISKYVWDEEKCKNEGGYLG